MGSAGDVVALTSEVGMFSTTISWRGVFARALQLGRIGISTTNLFGLASIREMMSRSSVVGGCDILDEVGDSTPIAVLGRAREFEKRSVSSSSFRILRFRGTMGDPSSTLELRCVLFVVERRSIVEIECRLVEHLPVGVFSNSAISLIPSLLRSFALLDKLDAAGESAGNSHTSSVE